MNRKFNFSRSEKIGVAVLSLLILGLLFILSLPRHKYIPDLLLSTTEEVKYISPKNRVDAEVEVQSGKINNSKTQYHEFDPNEYDLSDWVDIGFSKKQATVILKYKAQIKGFKTVEDLASCFVIDRKKINEMKPFLRFEKPMSLVLVEEPVVPPIELNEASAEQLLSIKGIGPYFAEEILELGEKLGGYFYLHQIKDIYGMTDENFERVVGQLIVDSSLVKRINLKEASFHKLKKHPYLNWKQSQILIGLSDKEVNEAFWARLSDEAAFSEDDISRLKPYLE